MPGITRYDEVERNIGSDGLTLGLLRQFVDNTMAFDPESVVKVRKHHD